MFLNEQKINWKKGLFRLWIILSLMWMILVFSFGDLLGHIKYYVTANEVVKSASSTVGEREYASPSEVNSKKNQGRDLLSPDFERRGVSNEINNESVIIDPLQPKRKLKLSDVMEEEKALERLLEIILLGIKPPIFGLVLWFAFVWAFRGFKSAN